MLLTLVIEVKTFEYLTYMPSTREMYIRNYKVHLTPFESNFINYLICHNGYCDMSDFGEYINILRQKDLSRKSLVVGINRLRKRVIYQTGFPILKNRYGYGYILNY